MSNNFELLVDAYVQELQELDTAATELLQLITLDGAEGVQLDGLGQILGVDREGLSDEQYRSLLRAYVQVNTSSGTIEELITVSRLALGIADDPAEIVVHEEQYPAGFTISYDSSVTVHVGEITAEAIYQGKAAGIHGIFQYFHSTPVFAFDGANGGSKFDGGHYLKTAIRNRAGRESEIL